MKVAIFRFNSSTFEVVHPDGKRRAFLKREDREFVDALEAEAAYNAKVAKMPFGLGRLVAPPSIEIPEARWQSLRARISGTFPAVKL